MIRDRKENDHRHFAIEPPRIQVGVKTKPRAHEGRPKAEGPAEIVGGENSVIDAFQSDRLCARHPFNSSIRVYISRAAGRQAVIRATGPCVSAP
jgi:hypothetical protein